MQFVWKPVDIHQVITINNAQGTPNTRASRIVEEYITQHMSNNTTMMVPIGALQFISDVTTSLASKEGTNVLFLFGDKTFGSRTSFVLSGEKEHEYPIIVHHGENQTSGCLSTSVDLSFISTFVKETAQRAHTTAITATTATRSSKVEDRSSGSGGEFDVYAMSTNGNVLNNDKGQITSVCDIQTIIGLTELNLHTCSFQYLIQLIVLTNYDYNVFTVLCWTLGSALIQERQEQEQEEKAATTTKNSNISVQTVITVGQKCFENWYDVAATHQNYLVEYEKCLLMYGRWLYVIGAFDEIDHAFQPWLTSHSCRAQIFDFSKERLQLAEHIMYLWLRAGSKTELSTFNYQQRVDRFRTCFPNSSKDLTKR